MTLYEIDVQITELMAIAEQQAIENAGVIDDQLGEQLESLDMAREAKWVNIGRMIKNLDAESEAIANETKKLTTRKKSCENKIEWLKKYLGQSIGEGNKYSDPTVVISWRASESVVVNVDSVKDLPNEYIVWDARPDKTSIKEKLKKGIAIEGCKLIKTNNIQIK